MPNVDAANICYNALRIAAGNGVTVGGILLGAALPAHILTRLGDGAPHRRHDRLCGGRCRRQPGAGRHLGART